MPQQLEFKTTGDGAGFVAELEGFLCTVTPKADTLGIRWDWKITSGGGWTHRGGENVTTEATGFGMDAEDAERKMIEWVERNG